MDGDLIPRLIVIAIAVAWTVYNFLRFKRWRAKRREDSRAILMMVFTAGCMAFGIIFAWTAAVTQLP